MLLCRSENLSREKTCFLLNAPVHSVVAACIIQCHAEHHNVKSGLVLLFMPISSVVLICRLIISAKEVVRSSLFVPMSICKQVTLQVYFDLTLVTLRDS